MEGSGGRTKLCKWESGEAEIGRQEVTEGETTARTSMEYNHTNGTTLPDNAKLRRIHPNFPASCICRLHLNEDNLCHDNRRNAALHKTYVVVWSS